MVQREEEVKLKNIYPEGWHACKEIDAAILCPHPITPSLGGGGGGGSFSPESVEEIGRG